MGRAVDGADPHHALALGPAGQMKLPTPIAPIAPQHEPRRRDCLRRRRLVRKPSLALADAELGARQRGFFGCGTPLTQKIPPGWSVMTYCPLSSHSAIHTALPSIGACFSIRTIFWQV